MEKRRNTAQRNICRYFKILVPSSSQFHIHCSVHRHCILIRSNKMQQMQVFITENLLYMFRTSIDSIIRSTSNCNYSFWYRSYYQGSDLVPAWPFATLAEDRCPDTMTCTRSCSFSLMYSWWWGRYTPETCRVSSQ